MRKLYITVAAIVAGLSTAAQAGPPIERESIRTHVVNEELFLTIEMVDEFSGGSFVLIDLTELNPFSELVCSGVVIAPSNIVQLTGSAKQGSATANAMLDALDCSINGQAAPAPDSVSLSCEHDDGGYFSGVGQNKMIVQGERFTFHGTHKAASAACLIELNGDVYNSQQGFMTLDQQVANE